MFTATCQSYLKNFERHWKNKTVRGLRFSVRPSKELPYFLCRQNLGFLGEKINPVFTLSSPAHGNLVKANIHNRQRPGDSNPAITRFLAPTGGSPVPRDVTRVTAQKNGGIIGF